MEVALGGIIMRGRTPVPTSAIDKPEKIKGLQGDDPGRGDFEMENIKNICTLIHLSLKKHSIGFSFALSSQLLIEGWEEVVIDRRGKTEDLIGDSVPIPFMEGLVPTCIRHARFTGPALRMHLCGDVGETF
jgi:hypothetical protein